MPSYHTPFLLVSVIHFITGLRERVLLEITVWTTSETSSPCHFTVSLDFLFCHYLVPVLRASDEDISQGL